MFEVFYCHCMGFTVRNYGEVFETMAEATIAKEEVEDSMFDSWIKQTRQGPLQAPESEFEQWLRLYRLDFKKEVDKILNS